MAKEIKSMSHHPSGKPHVTSERHDALYSKARYVLNQRHIKRPWFNLNPFLEKTDETEDLDNFLPEESKYIQRLESLVLCESFKSDHPVDTKEIALGKFFEYLYSGEWKEGCSIRVLEGQLLDQLLISLYRLERENKVIRHTTYAFARNKRQITGCYKLADKEAYGVREETLLIEFAYFGSLAKDQPNVKSQNPMEYLREGVAEYLDGDTCSSDKPVLSSLQEDSSTTHGKRRSRAPSMQVDHFHSINLTDPNKSELPKWGRRGSIMSKHVNAIRFVNTLNTQARRQSIATTQGIGTSSRGFMGTQERRRESAIGTLEDTKGRRRRSSVATVDSQFSKHNRKLSLADQSTPDSDIRSPLFSDEVDDPDEGQIPSLAEDKTFYGDEFYLADDQSKTKRNQESSLIKLRRKKKELRERREAVKKEMEAIAKNKKASILPPLSPLDMSKVKDNATMHHTIKLPEILPTFEEFVKLLKDDEYFDPRYRNKVRLKSKIIAQRYYIAKGMHRSSIMFNLEHLPDDVKYVGLTKRYMQQRASVVNNQIPFSRERRGSNGVGSKGKLRLPALLEGGKRSSKKTDNLSNVSIASNQNRDPLRFADEVHGVTDSEPCREHCLQGKGSLHKQREEKTDRMRQGKGNTDLANSGQDVVLTTVTEEGSGVKLKKSQQSKSSEERNVLATRSSSGRAGQPSPVFPKIDLCDDDIESPESETEESESDDDSPSLFDSSKLNVRYSIERLRKKRRMKRRRPAFIDILAKYYKMHAALKAFRKGSASREEKGARERAKRMGRSKKSIAKVKEGQEFVIGKLRKFSFNDVKPKKRLNLEGLSRGDFSKPDITSFHETLQKAINDFVIRREIVVSDTQTFFRAATSVTFTRKSCFKKKHIDM